MLLHSTEFPCGVFLLGDNPCHPVPLLGIGTLVTITRSFLGRPGELGAFPASPELCHRSPVEAVTVQEGSASWPYWGGRGLGRGGGLPRKSLGRPQDQGGQFLSGTSGQSSRIDLCSQALSTRSRIGGGTCHVSLDTLLFRVLHSVSLQVHPEQAPTPCTFSAHTLSGPLPQGKQSPLGPFSLPCSQQGSLNQHWPAW